MTQKEKLQKLIELEGMMFICVQAAERHKAKGADKLTRKLSDKERVQHKEEHTLVMSFVDKVNKMLRELGEEEVPTQECL